MSTPFQNRLVGTVIVAAVAIIFLPDLLDGDKKTYQEEFERIPNTPKVDFKIDKKTFPSDKLNSLASETLSDEVALDDENESLPSADKDQRLQSNDSPSNVAQDSDENQTTKVDALTKEKSISASAVVNLPAKAEENTAWVIQLGSFRHKKNVDELVNKLTKAGYTVFTKPIKTKSGTLTKVFVGPELIKASLEKKIPALNKLTNVQGKIARYSPVKE